MTSLLGSKYLKNHFLPKKSNFSTKIDYTSILDQNVENTKSLDDEIQGVIRTNQTLLRKKGLLKRLLEDSAIQHLLKHVLKYNEKEKGSIH